MIHKETHAVTLERGPRPAGKPTECFYCNTPVGSVHDPTCVLRERTVVLRYSYEVVVVVPESWDQEQIHFHRNDSSWCANNSLDTLQTIADSESCLCRAFTAEFVREATKDDEIDQPFALGYRHGV